MLSTTQHNSNPTNIVTPIITPHITKKTKLQYLSPSIQTHVTKERKKNQRPSYKENKITVFISFHRNARSKVHYTGCLYGYQSQDSFGRLRDTSSMADMQPGVMAAGSHGTPPLLFAGGPPAASAAAGRAAAEGVVAPLAPGPGAAGDGEPPPMAARTRAPPSPLVAMPQEGLAREEGGCHDSPQSEKPSSVIRRVCRWQPMRRLGLRRRKRPHRGRRPRIVAPPCSSALQPHRALVVREPDGGRRP